MISLRVWPMNEWNNFEKFKRKQKTKEASEENVTPHQAVNAKNKSSFERLLFISLTWLFSFFFVSFVIGELFVEDAKAMQT